MASKQGGTVMEPSKRPMLIGPLGLAQTRKDYNYGSVRALAEAIDDLKEWGANVINVSVLDGGKAITVAGNSTEHLSEDNLQKAMSLNYSKAVARPGGIGLAGRGTHIFSFVPGDTGMMVSVSEERREITLATASVRCQGKDENAHVRVVSWTCKPGQDARNPAAYEAKDRAGVDALIEFRVDPNQAGPSGAIKPTQVLPYATEAELLESILSAMDKVHKNALKYNPNAAFGGVLYEVSGLVSALDFNNDTTDIRLADDHQNDVFFNRHLDQPMPPWGRSLRAALERHYLDWDMLKEINLRGTAVKQVAIIEDVLQHAKKWPLPNGMGHLTIGVEPHRRRGVYVYAKGILVVPNDESLLPRSWDGFVTGFVGVVEYTPGTDAPNPCSNKCTIIHPFPVVQFCHKKFNEYFADYFASGKAKDGLGRDDRYAIRKKIHGDVGTLKNIAVLAKDGGTKVAECGKCGKFREVKSDGPGGKKLQKTVRDGQFCCASMQQHAACYIDEEDWAARAAAILAAAEEQQEEDEEDEEEEEEEGPRGASAAKAKSYAGWKDFDPLGPDAPAAKIQKMKEAGISLDEFRFQRNAKLDGSRVEHQFKFRAPALSGMKPMRSAEELIKLVAHLNKGMLPNLTLASRKGSKRAHPQKKSIRDLLNRGGGAAAEADEEDGDEDMDGDGEEGAEGAYSEGMEESEALGSGDGDRPDGGKQSPQQQRSRRTSAVGTAGAGGNAKSPNGGPGSVGGARGGSAAKKAAAAASSKGAKANNKNGKAAPKGGAAAGKTKGGGAAAGGLANGGALQNKNTGAAPLAKPSKGAAAAADSSRATRAAARDTATASPAAQLVAQPAAVASVVPTALQSPPGNAASVPGAAEIAAAVAFASGPVGAKAPASNGKKRGPSGTGGSDAPTSPLKRVKTESGGSGQEGQATGKNDASGTAGAEGTKEEMGEAPEQPAALQPVALPQAEAAAPQGMDARTQAAVKKHTVAFLNGLLGFVPEEYHDGMGQILAEYLKNHVG